VDEKEKFLDTQGTGDIAVWGEGGVNYVISGNTSQWAGNLRWKIVQCPQPGRGRDEYYIINANHNGFLRCEKTGVDVWKNSGLTTSETIGIDNRQLYPQGLPYRPEPHYPGVRWRILSVASFLSSSSSSSSGEARVRASIPTVNESSKSPVALE
jgi:hypothetical protein